MDHLKLISSSTCRDSVIPLLSCAYLCNSSEWLSFVCPSTCTVLLLQCFLLKVVVQPCEVRASSKSNDALREYLMSTTCAGNHKIVTLKCVIVRSQPRSQASLVFVLEVGRRCLTTSTCAANLRASFIPQLSAHDLVNAWGLI